MRTFTHQKLQQSLRGLCMIAFLLLCAINGFAQILNITGKVTDAKNNQTIPGVSVQLKGTSKGTATNSDGEFKINAEKGDIIIISFVGYLRQEITVGDKKHIDVTLKEDVRELQGVVVTALGIKRQQESLGFATQTIGDKDMTDARANNWVSALSGKVAGLTLTTPGSGPLGSTRITLRGDKSLSPNGNNALIVLDGVPMSSDITGSGAGNAYQAGSGADVPIDFGNGINDINPDDIESITVLKGAGATALYGSRAANGALIITTKSGARKSKGLGVTVNSSISVNDVLKWPAYQYEYGQGVGKTFDPAANLYYSYGRSDDGANTGSTSSAFGPKFNGQQYFQYDPEIENQSLTRKPWQPYTNNIKGFWKTGYTLTNSVSLEGGGEKGSTRASVTHSKNEWIMPNTGFERLTVALSTNQKVSDKLRINAKVNYTNKKSDNLPATGYNNQSIAYFMIFQNPNVDLDWYRPIWKKGREQLEQVHPFSSYIDNPYLIAYEMTNSLNSHNVVGNLSANYEVSKHFDFMVRSGINLTAESRQQRRPYNTANFAAGYYKEQNINRYEINTDALLTYHQDLSPKFKLSASVGANALRSRYTANSAYINGLVTPNVYKLSNGQYSIIYTPDHANKNVNSTYAFTNLSYDNKIFLDLTARNDWSSTLPRANASFFYPSANTSFILNRLFKLPEVISYAKLRLSVAKVGNDTDPYRERKYYIISEFPSSATTDNTLYNVNFKPELTTSYEAGLEYQLFGGRLGMDVSVYRTNTQNQIIPIALEPSTGYARAIVNAGTIQNRGVEIVLNAKPVVKGDFKWNTTITWARNVSKVLELAERFGGDKQLLIGTGGTASVIAQVGGRMGDIYGFGFVRNPEGKIVYNKDGLTEKPAEIQYIGNAYADWKGGISNEFFYKNFRFSFLIDGQVGGIVYSQTHHKMSEQGKLKSTLPGREEGFIIGDGVVLNADGTYSTNTKKVTVGDYYADYYRRANVEANAFDASFLKLREVRLEYNLPKRLLGRARINAASVALYGRDLAVITSYPMFDPETAALNGNTILPGIEMGQLPSMRTFGLNLTLKF